MIATAKKAKPVGDVTRTARAKSLVQRLQDAGGKRAVIDFDSDGVKDLQKLLSAGYASTQREAVLKAVKEAAKIVDKTP